jgi:hypothetical protein
MTILCVICSENVPEEKYPEHMQMVHGGKSQLESIQQQKEIADNLPKLIPLNKDAPIPLEMQQVIQEMEKPVPKVEATPVQAPVVPQNAPKEQKPLELHYVWQGNCPQCNNAVRTVITKVDGRWFATAYCLDHKEVDQQEVTPLDIKPGQQKFEPIIDTQREKEVNERELNVPKNSPRKTKVRPMRDSEQQSLSSK